MRRFTVGVVALSSLFLAACGEVTSNASDAREIDAKEIDAFVGTPMLAIDRDTADFGMVIVGQTSAATTFTVSNTGDGDSGALTVQLTGDGFAKTADTCNGMTLAPEADCSISVTLSPTAPGSPTGTLRVTGAPGGSVMASLSGTALAPGSLSVNPMNHDFGVVAGGSTSIPKAFTFTNGGGAATGNVAITLAGADAAQFEIVADMCSGAPLGAGRTCDVSARMKPGAAASGTKNATLTAMASPGGAAVAMLSGTAQLPAVIALGGSGAFGDVVIGSPMVRTITVTNSGQQTTGALTIQRTGAASFSILTGMAGDCVSGTTTLVGAASCNVRVQFAPSAPGGAAAGMLTVSATPGGSQSTNLSGNGQRPATLSANISNAPFGLVEVGVVSTNSFVWIITNTGDVASSAATFATLSTEIDTTGGNTCNAVIMPGGTCSVTLKFKPSAGGARSGTATVSITGSMVQLMATATGGFRVNVTRNGNGGAITSNPAGINCPTGSCTGLFAPGNVLLEAATTNGSGFYFSGWSGASAGTCGGTPNQDCTLAVDGTEAVTATFSAITSNLVFVSAATFPTTLNGTAPYDAACNAAATAAGINNAAGNNYIAMISDANSNGWNRLGTVAAASGWVRLDGRVFATTRANLQAGVVLNPVRFTETGAEAGAAFLMTGTYQDGTINANGTCQNWTTNAAGNSAIVGNSFGGPEHWVGDTGIGCSSGPYRLLCMMKQFTTGTAAPATFTGKKLWLTNSAYIPATTNNPDSLCNSERPSGVATGRALIGRTTAAASTSLTAAQMYVRLDGQEVGTGAEITANQHRGGIWQQASGAYYNGRVWTGSTSISTLGTAATTCGDWVTPAQMGIQSISGRARDMWNIGFSPFACSNIPATGPRLYCYEP